ncbi:MAG: anti-sigma factor domain-containing protein, partial [Chitinophagales bacterium]
MNANIFRFITLAALMISLIANVFFLSELNSTDERIKTLKEEKAVFEQQYKVLQRNYEVANENFNVLRQADTQIIQLQSPIEGNASKAVIYWNQKESTIYIDADGLTPPLATKQYQVWALQKDEYKDLGVFNYQMDVANFFRMKNPSEADGFVVSLEKIRG